MKIGKLIGIGATAEVYDYEDNKIIKLYNADQPESSLQWEYNKMKYANQYNLSCPKVYELVEIDGRHGYIMEKYNGINLNEKIMNDVKRIASGEMSIETFSTNYFNSVKGTARVLYEVHKVKIPEWHKINDQLLWDINETDLLDQEMKMRIIDLIESLPEDTSVCHGDPNPNNIMICDGEYKLIDWVNAGIGNPMYDIADYVWMNTPKKDIKEVDFEGVPQVLIDFYLQNIDAVNPVFLNEYKRLSGKDIPSCEPYIIPLLVKKLRSNRTVEEKSKIVVEIKERLSRL